jgi:protein KRI1
MLLTSSFSLDLPFLFSDLPQSPPLYLSSIRYILNRGWIDRSSEHVPSYNEITASKPKKTKKKAKEEDNSDLSADEGDNKLVEVEDDGFDDMADEFETRYNFRFEEP